MRGREDVTGLVCGTRRVLAELHTIRTPSGHLRRRVRCICSKCGDVAEVYLNGFKRGRCAGCRLRLHEPPQVRPEDVRSRELQAALTEAQERAPWLWRCLRHSESPNLPDADAKALAEARTEAIEGLVGLLGEMSTYDIAALTGVSMQRVAQITMMGLCKAETIARNRGLSVPDARDERTWPETYAA